MFDINTAGGDCRLDAMPATRCSAGSQTFNVQWQSFDAGEAPLDFDHSTPKIIADAPQVKRGREQLFLLQIASDLIVGFKTQRG